MILHALFLVSTQHIKTTSLIHSAISLWFKTYETWVYVYGGPSTSPCTTLGIGISLFTSNVLIGFSGFSLGFRWFSSVFSWMFYAFQLLFPTFPVSATWLSKPNPQGPQGPQASLATPSNSDSNCSANWSAIRQPPAERQAFDVVPGCLR